MSLLENVPFACPYCGASLETSVETTAGDQDYVEDCAVCCQPIDMHAHVGGDGELRRFEAKRQDD